MEKEELVRALTFVRETIQSNHGPNRPIGGHDDFQRVTESLIESGLWEIGDQIAMLGRILAEETLEETLRKIRLLRCDGPNGGPQ